MALVAIVVALTDIVIKLCALTLLGERSVAFAPWLRFAIYFNENMAWGLTTGSHPALITLAATVVVLTMGGVVVRELTVVDRLAPIALGLILGAGLANGLDGLFPPHGAVDFIVFSHGAAETAINGADLAVLLGLALCCRMLVLLGAAIDRQRASRRPAVIRERAVPLALYAEPGQPVRATTRPDARRAPAPEAPPPLA